MCTNQLLTLLILLCHPWIFFSGATQCKMRISHASTFGVFFHNYLIETAYSAWSTPLPPKKAFQLCFHTRSIYLVGLIELKQQKKNQNILTNSIRLFIGPFGTQYHGNGTNKTEHKLKTFLFFCTIRSDSCWKLGSAAAIFQWLTELCGPF